MVQAPPVPEVGLGGRVGCHQCSACLFLFRGTERGNIASKAIELISGRARIHVRIH